MQVDYIDHQPQDFLLLDKTAFQPIHAFGQLVDLTDSSFLLTVSGECPLTEFL